MNKTNVKVSPSMMCADFIHLSEEIAVIEKYDFDYLHIDIMDGHYVPNLTLGPGFCDKIATATILPLDIHLMVENVDHFIPMFTHLKGSNITFHPEASRHPLRSLEAIRKAGCRPGLAVDPAQPIEVLRYMLPAVDLVLLMTVNPGYSGQKLVPGALEKIRMFASYASDAAQDLEIIVDGNVSWENIPAMINAGGTTLVAGTSSLFGAKEDRDKDASRLKALVNAD